MKPAVLLIDLQREFVKDGRLKEHKKKLVSSVNELTEFARKEGFPVIWVRQEFKRDLSDAPIGSKKPGLRIPIKGTAGSKLISGLVVKAKDLQIVKKRYSAFFNTPLEETLKELRVDTLIVAGVNTHACIRTSVIDAYQLDYPVVIANDCTDSYDKEHHDTSMKYLTINISTSKTNKDILNTYSSPRSSGAFVTHKGKHLLMLRDNFPYIKNPNTWSILGGITEIGETPEESLIRELKEEANIDVIDYQLLFHYPSGESVYHINLNDHQFKKLKLGDEGKDLQFFTRVELVELPLSSTVRDYLRDKGKLIKGLTWQD